MGPLGLALAVLGQGWLGALSSREASGAARRLRQRQLSDGGFQVNPAAQASTLGATVVCRAALKACGVADTDAAVKRAEARIRALGGYELVRRRFESGADLAGLFCAMTGLLPASILPPLSPTMAGLPWSERMLDGRMHAGVPVGIYAMAAVCERLKPKSRLPGFLELPLRAVAKARLAGFIGGFQNPNGSWNGSVINTVFSLVALSGVGLGLEDPSIARGLAWLRTRQRWMGDAFEVSIFDAENWETGFCMLALQACDVAPSDPALQSAANYLVGTQCRELQPRTNQPDAAATRTGGWAFQSGNEKMPDCDDTGVVVAALGAHAGAFGSREVFASIEKGVAWLRAMQNDSGGFASYVHNLPEKAPGSYVYGEMGASVSDPKALLKLVLDPPLELGDTPTADMTGRVLWALGNAGLDKDDPLVARAIAWLERDACSSGAWWGMWNPAHVSGTAFALIGLAAVDADLESTAAKRAVAWLLSVQNADGGWGESWESFHDASLAGQAESMPPLTGIVLRALADVLAASRRKKLARGSERSKELAAIKAAGARAVKLMIRTQQRDGSWPDRGYIFTIVPPTFYTWDLHRLYYPLVGLGAWRAASAGRR